MPSRILAIFAIPNEWCCSSVVEQWTENPRVASSILASTTKFNIKTPIEVNLLGFNVLLRITRCITAQGENYVFRHRCSDGRPLAGRDVARFPAGCSRAGKGCRPWEVRCCRGFLQRRKNLRRPGPRPVHALLRKPRDRPPALMRRGSHSHGATPFPASLSADMYHS